MRRRPPVWALVLTFRVLQSFAVVTTFNPDEYWQSLEPAYFLVFGEGTLTWEWRAHLRGWTHPLVFAALYKALAVLGLDSPFALIAAPRVLQASLCAGCDLCVHRLAARWLSPRVAPLALLMSLTNWFNFFCGPRTFANCMETCCTAAALTAYPLRSKPTRSELRRLFLFAGCGVVLRQTNVLVWLPVAMDLFITHPTQAADILSAGVAAAAFWVAWSVGIDTYLYGQPVFCMWEFFKFNALEGKSEAFGVHPWHWYASQGLPAILGTQGIAVAVSLLCPLGWAGRKPLLLALYVVAVYSLFGHKEFRFIYPVLPICLVYAGHGLWYLRQSGWARLYRALLSFAVVTNAAAAFYFSVLHQRATVSVSAHLRNLPSTAVGPAANRHVDFLMGCHQTPGLAYFHRSNLTLNWMDCTTAFGPDGRRQPTQHSRFFSAPRPWVSWVYDRIPPEDHPEITAEAPRPLPLRFVLYDTMAHTLQAELGAWGYALEASLLHTPTPAEEHTSRWMHIYRPADRSPPLTDR